MQIGLKREEKLFCYYFAETGDISLSAEKAGFSHDAFFKILSLSLSQLNCNLLFTQVIH